MIEKHSHVLAFDPVNGQNVWILGDDLEKTASIIKVAELSPEVERVIESLVPQEGVRHVLVNGMGAGEFWSSNRNGDYFPESGLKHAGEDYGYTTFLKGHNFVHHNNKDPKVAVGEIKFAHYNPRMHRCELILATDLGKLARVDEEIYEKVARGEPVDVSMGSKCDFDVCSICSKRSATRAEYCEHLKEAMNQTLEDGRKVYAYTPHPRFFDMSYVTKGADVTAKALHYLDKAAADSDAPRKTYSAPQAKVASCPDPEAHREAVVVSVPDYPAELKDSVLLVEATEKRISAEKLAALSKLGFNKALATASHLGIVYRPDEYQYLALSALGQKEAAERMDQAGFVFPQDDRTWFDPTLKPIPAQVDFANFDEKCAEILCDYVADRTIYEPYFSARYEKIARYPKGLVTKLAAALPIEKRGAFMTAELAAALALGYLVYRGGVPGTKTEAIEKAMHLPDLKERVVTIILPLIAGGSVVDTMLSHHEEKHASAAGIIAPVAGAYLYSAYAKRKAEQGRPINAVEHAFMDYPLPLALGGVYAASKFRGTMPKKAGTIPGVMKSASELAMAMGSGLYRPRASGVLGYMADNAIASGLAALAAGVKSLTGGKDSKKKS